MPKELNTSEAHRIHFSSRELSITECRYSITLEIIIISDKNERSEVKDMLSIRI
jgi:hypothetical protein